MKHELNKMLKLSKIATATIICTKHTLLGVSLFTLLTAPVTVAHAGFLSDAMDLKANIMSNTTAPASYNSASRHVFSGGGIVAKNKIFSTDIVSLTPPSMTSGCGGINMYMGAFSFINKDQIVTLFRSIAQNAIGYLFKIALKALSEMISSTIEEFQNIVQKLNEFLGNSCQLAQGLVDGGLDALLDRESKKEGNWARMQGKARDVYDAFQNLSIVKYFSNDGKSEKEPTRGGEKRVSQNTDGKIKEEDDSPSTGNLTYKAIVKSTSINSALGSKNPGTNTKVKDFTPDQAGEIMALTGVVIVDKQEQTSQSSAKAESVGGDGTSKTDLTFTFKALPPLNNLHDLVEYDGGNLGTYKCSSGNDCNEPKAQPQGGGQKGYLCHQIMQTLCGTDYNQSLGTISCNNGLIEKWAGPDGQDVTTEEKNILNGLPEPMRRLSNLLVKTAKRAIKNGTASNAVGKTFENHIKVVATEVAYQTVRDTIQNVRNGLNNLNLEPERTDKAFKMLEEAEKAANDDYTALRARYGTIENLEKMIQLEIDAHASKGALNTAL